MNEKTVALIKIVLGIALIAAVVIGITLLMWALLGPLGVGIVIVVAVIYGWVRPGRKKNGE